jgi:hypothetical protein
MSQALNEIVDYLDLIDYNQDVYYEIRDYLRDSDETQEDQEKHITDTWGAPWSDFVDELIGDVRDLQEYESANGLPTGS